MILILMLFFQEQKYQIQPATRIDDPHFLKEQARVQNFTIPTYKCR